MKLSTVRCRLQRHLKYGVLGVTMAIALGLAHPSFSLSAPSPIRVAQTAAPTLEAEATSPASSQAFADEGQQLYQSGRLQEAEASLKQALAPYPADGRGIRQAVALSNLALVQGQLGKWNEANKNLGEGLKILDDATLPAPESLRKSVQAQVLDVQGRLQYSQGKPQDALKTWRASSALYGRLGNLESQVRSQIRQAQAMRALGFYRLAIDSILTPVGKSLEDQPTSMAKVTSLQNLGEALQIAGDLKDAEDRLRDSLALAKELKEPEAIAHSQLSLANTLQAQVLKKLPASKQRGSNLTFGDALKRKIKDTQTAYEAVISTSRNPLNRLRAQLNYLSFALELRRPQTAQQIWSGLQDLNAIPVSRAGIDAQVNLVNSLMELQDQRPRAVNATTIERILAQAYDQAIAIDDLRAQSYVLGELGTFYQRQQDPSRALEFTQQAILLANVVNAPDIAYQWYAQQGDLLIELGKWNRGEAIAAYQAAVKNLSLLRSDLAAVNPDATFSFQESVDPIHRKLVSLLLEQYRESPEGLGIDNLGAQRKAADAKPKDTDKTKTPLEEIQGIMESLRVEELHEYFRAACLDAQEVDVQKVATDEKAAVIYPIVLENELATIVTLPDQTPKLYSTSKEQTDLEQTVADFRYALTNTIDTEGFKQPGQAVYDLLFPQDLQADLGAKDTEALVFVLDGVLRNIPMAALWDGEQFLIQKYGVVSTPGLQLVAPTPLQDRGLGAVAFGLSQGRKVNLEDGESVTFTDLPNVEREIDALETNIPSTEVIEGQRFTKESFKQILRRSTAPIVHLATHGQFSSDRESTFLLAAEQQGDDGLIKLDELASALQVGAGDRTQPVELLVLSACETALGDDRAALGIAGVALRSGARSTVASLWTVDDEATSDLMAEFYELLKKDRTISKAEALRQAQLHFLEELELPENDKFRKFRKHPYHWASFILVGNWL